MHLPANPKSQETRVGWVGHSTVLINFSGTTVLTAPNFSRRIKIARRLVDLPLEPEDKIGIGEGLTTFTLPHHQGIRVRTRRFM